MRLGVRWAGASALTGAILWTLLAGFGAELVDGHSLADTLRNWLPIVAWIGAFGLVTAAFAFVPYAILLSLWPRIASAFPQVERTKGALFLVTGGLALPLVLVVMHAFASASPFASAGYWAQVRRVLPFVVLACWGALLLPRLLLPSLRPGIFLQHRENAA
jgi:hypothetical protein